MTTPARSPRWPAVLALLLALYQVAYLAFYLTRRRAPGDPPFSDFYAFWSFSRFLRGHDAAGLYDFGQLSAFQHQLLDGFQAFYPFVYPPILLPLLWPLGALPYGAAYGAWLAVGLAGFCLAVLGSEWRSPVRWLAVVAPTTILTIVAGQNGLMTGALLIGGFRLMERRPWLAGVLLGLLAVKPQLFVLAPLALLAGRRWRTLAATILTGVVLTAFSALAFGLATWMAWLKALPAFAATAVQQGETFSGLMPTVTAALRGMGLSGPLVTLAQLASAVAIIAVLALLFHRDRGRPAPGALAVAALQAGVFLVTPYAFVYDMTIVSAAVASLLAARLAQPESWKPGEQIIAIAAYGLPLFLFSGAMRAVPIGPVVLAALFAILVRAAWTDAATPRTAP